MICMGRMSGKEKNFRQVCYTIWTLKELYSRIKSSPKRSVESILDDFRSDMDYYATLNLSTSYIFSVAYDTATFVYDWYVGGDGVSAWNGKNVSD